MKLNKTQKLILSLMLTGTVTSAKTMDLSAFFSAALQKPVTRVEAENLGMQPELSRAIAADIKSKDYEEKQISEILSDFQSATPGQSATEIVEGVGVVSELKKAGRGTTEDDKKVAKLIKKAGYSIADNDAFASTKIAYDANLFNTHSDVDSRVLIESVITSKKTGASDVDSVDNAHIQPWVEVAKAGIAKPTEHHIAAKAAFAIAGGTLTKVPLNDNPDTASLEAIAFLREDGKNNPSLNRYNKVKYLQAQGIAKPTAELRDAYDALVAGTINVAAIVNPSRTEILAKALTTDAGNADPSQGEFEAAQAYVLKAEEILTKLKSQGFPAIKDATLDDPIMLAAIDRVDKDHVALGLTNEAEISMAIMGVFYLGKEHGVAAAHVTEADLDGLDYLFNELKIKNPSKKELKAVKESQDLGQHLKEPKPSKEDIAAIIQLQKKVASGGHNIANPTPENVNVLKRLPALLGIAPIREQAVYALRHPAANDVDLKKGMMKARLKVLGINAPIAEQIAFGALNLNAVDKDLKEGAMNARLIALGINAPIAEQIAFGALNLNAVDKDLKEGAMNARLIALGINAPIAEQIAFGALNLNAVDKDLKEGAMNARLIALGINAPIAEQIAFGALNLNAVDKDLKEGAMNARLIALGINAPIAEQIAFGALNLNAANNALVEGAMNARLIALGINAPIAEQIAFGALNLNAVDKDLKEGAMNARLIALGINAPIAEQIAFGALNLNAANNALVEGAMNARLIALGINVPTNEQVVFGVAHLNVPNNGLIRGAMTARLRALLGGKPTKIQIDNSLGHLNANDLDLQAAI